MKKKNKSILFISLTIIMFFFVISGLVVSLKLGEQDQSVNKDKLEVVFNSSQNVELKNILPMSDELGKKLNNQSVEKSGYGYLNITVKNRSNKKLEYNIYIIKNADTDSKINDKFIKFYLTDKSNNPVGNYGKNVVPTYLDLLSMSSLPAGRIIYSDTLEENQEKSFILRSWVSDFYNMVEEEESFDFDVFVKSK